MTDPVVPSGQVFNIAANAQVGTFIGYVQASDVDNSPLYYTDVTNPAQEFFSVSVSGVITLKITNPPASSVLSIQVCNISNECTSTTITIGTGSTLQPFQTPYLYFGGYNNAYFMPFPGIGNLTGSTSSGTPTGNIGYVLNTSGSPFGNPSTSTGQSGTMPTEYFGANWAFSVGNIFVAGTDQIYLSQFTTSTDGTQISIPGPVSVVSYPPNCGVGATSAFVSGNSFYYATETSVQPMGINGGCLLYAPIDLTTGSFGTPPVEVKTPSGDSFGPYIAFATVDTLYYTNGGILYYADFAPNTAALTSDPDYVLDVNGNHVTSGGLFVHQGQLYYSSNGATYYASITSPGQLGPATEIRDEDGASFSSVWMSLSFNAIQSPPVIDANQVFYVQKDANVGSTIGYVSVSNLNGSTANFVTTGAANAFFAISPAGLITLSAALTTETTQTLALQAVTQYGISTVTNVSIMIQAILLPQTFGMNPTLQPNTSFGAVYINSTQPYTFSITSNASGVTFAINSTTGQLSYTSGTPTTGTTYTITVQAAGTTNHTAVMTIAVATGLPFSFATGQSFSANTNQTFIGNISYDNPTGDPVNFTFSGSGTPYSYFTLNATTCALAASSTPLPSSGSTGYPLTVKETNSNTTTNVVVYVFNPGPQISNQTLPSVHSQTYTQVTPVGNVAAVDTNGSPITFAITQVLDPNGQPIPSQTLFQLSDNEIEIQSGATLLQGSYTLTISATSDGMTNTANITVPVSGYAAPTIDPGQAFYINANASVGSFIGFIGVSTKGTTLTFSDISATLSPYFAISQTGGITVKAVIPYGTSTPQQLTIQVTDEQDATSQATINININSIFNNQTFSIAPSLKPNFNFASIAIAGNVTNYTFDITQDPLSGLTFAISSLGALSYTAGTLTPSTPTSTLTITATDSTGSYPATITIAVDTSLNQAFYIVPDQTFTVNVGQAAIGNIAYDNPGGGSVTFTAVTQPSLFQISSAGALSFVSTTPITTDTTFDLTVTANAGTGNVTQNVTVIVLAPGPQISDQAFSINSLVAGGTIIGTLFASDPNGQTITLSIVDNDDSTTPDWANFEIDGSFLKVVSNPTPWVSGTSVLTVQAMAGTLTSTATITINIDIYQGPEITPEQIFYVSKTLTPGAFVGYISALDPNGGNVTFELAASDTAASLFTINSAGGIYTAEPLTLDTQTLIVTVTNTGGLSQTGTVIVNMVSVLFDQNFGINPTTKPGTAFAAVAIDGNASQYTLSFEDDLTTTDLSAGLVFDIIDQNRLVYVSGPLGDIGSTYSFTMKATDITTQVVHTGIMTIAVVADNAFSIIPEQVFTVPVGQMPIGSVAYDNPTGGEVTFTEVTYNNQPTTLFSITSAGALSLTSATAVTSTTTYDLVIKANNVSQTVTVTVLAIGPQIQNQVFTISAAIGPNKTVGTIFAYDPSGNALTLTVENPSPYFVLENGNVLTTSSTFPTSGVGSVSLTVRATNTVTELFNEAVVTITVDTYLGPTIAPGQIFYVSKTLSPGAFVGYISALDPNGGNITFELSASDTASSLFSVDSAGGIYTAAPLTLDSQILAISVTNSGGLSAQSDIIINMVSVLFNQNFVINSTAQLGSAFAAVSIDGNASQYTLSFEDDLTVTDLSAGPTFDLINQNQLIYAAGSLGSLGSTYSFTMQATNIDTHVVHTGVMTVTVVEDSSFSIIPGQVFTVNVSQTAIGNIAYDNPSGGTVTFTAISPSAVFSVSSSGALSFVIPTNITTDTTFSNVIVTANGTTQSLTIIVLAPGPQISDQSFEITSLLTGGSIIGTLFASDPNGQTITLSIVDNDDSTTPDWSNFIIDGSFLKAISDPVWIPGTATLTVKATAGTLSSTATVTVTVADYLPPSINNNQVFFANANLPINSFIGTVSGYDPNGGSAAFSYTGSAAFSVTNSGEVFSKTSLAEVTSPQTMTVTITNQSTIPATTAITVNILSILFPQTFSLNVNTQANTTFTTISIDGSINQYTLAIATNASPAFTINPNGQLQFTGTIGSIGTTYTITVTAQNTTTGNIHSAPITINVTQDALFSILSGQKFSVGPGQTIIGTVGYDNPSGGRVAFALMTASPYFEISAAGVLSIKTDVTNLPVATMTLSIEETITGTTANVTIETVGPVLQNQLFSVSDPEKTNQAIGAILVSNTNGANVLLSITNPLDSGFTISNSNMLVSPPTTLASGDTELTVKASTSTGLATSAVVTVNVPAATPTPPPSPAITTTTFWAVVSTALIIGVAGLIIGTIALAKLMQTPPLKPVAPTAKKLPPHTSISSKPAIEL
jgi:hypothetical protein